MIIIESYHCLIDISMQVLVRGSVLHFDILIMFIFVQFIVNFYLQYFNFLHHNTLLLNFYFYLLVLHQMRSWKELIRLLDRCLLIIDQRYFGLIQLLDHYLLIISWRLYSLVAVRILGLSEIVLELLWILFLEILGLSGLQLRQIYNLLVAVNYHGFVQAFLQNLQNHCIQNLRPSNLNSFCHYFSLSCLINYY